MTTPPTPPQTVYGAIIALVSASISLAFAVVSALEGASTLSEGQVTAHAIAIVSGIYTIHQARRRASDTTRRGTLSSILLPLAIVALVALVASSAGCGPRMVRSEAPARIAIDHGPPCTVTVTVDGAEVFRSETDRCVAP